ncbi:tRNA (adenine-N1)-methyltransferase [Egibacter rhizosphaerae]|uniref:tRNA (adenine(58)-N(1))-methyltransferase TrmI n=2 Tax=Egibacter rhizosphaerae TaxID=1670831 RepID=A0A411YLU8_9ACTN|nr:tRNA (adenine-N1)-methyltransferase [Egibacter rhizosphaerae]
MRDAEDPPTTPAEGREPRHAGHPEPFGPGEVALLVDRKERRYLVTLATGGTFHYHGGAVAHDDLLGAAEGSRVRSAKGTTLLALRPTAGDWTLKAKRGAQVVYPKDQAMIVGLADIAPGCTVIEAGAGSGALTAALLRAVGPNGRVVSFELREDHATVAARSIADRFGTHPPNWTLEVADVVERLPGLSCDRLVLDLLEPDRIVPIAVEALHSGGILCAYTPSVPQVMRLREALDADRRWGLAQTVETLLRTWHVEGLAVRPDHRMVAHTAFLTTVRRLADE